MARDKKPQDKNDKPKEKEFFCPLGHAIMWWHNLEYSECPLAPSFRDMAECKGCKLRVDKKWEENKEDWKDKPAKPKRRRKKNKKHTAKRG